MGEGSREGLMAAGDFDSDAGGGDRRDDGRFPPCPPPEAVVTASRSARVAAFAAIYLVWGSSFLAVRYAVATIPPFAAMACRSLAAGLLLLIGIRLLGWRRARPRWPSRREWLHAGVAGGMLFVLGHGSLAFAERRAPSGVAALVMATIPLWLVALEAIRPGGSRPSARALVGLLGGLAGVALLVWTPGAAWSGGPGAGAGSILLVALSAVSWASGSMYARHAPRPESAAMHTGAQLLTGGTLLLLLSMAAGEQPFAAIQMASTRSLLSLAYLAAFGSVVTFTAYTWLLRVSTPSRVGTYALVNPVVAVVLGSSIGGEAMTFRLVAVLALIIGGVALAMTAPARTTGARRRRPIIRPTRNRCDGTAEDYARPISGANRGTAKFTGR